MLLTTLYLRLILIYHCLPPNIAIDRLRCSAEYALIKDSGLAPTLWAASRTTSPNLHFSITSPLDDSPFRQLYR
jgi:hypothetical protein